MRWLTSAEDSGERVDRYLADHYDQARNQVAAWIREGRVLVDGRVAKASLRLAGAEWIECEPLERSFALEMEPEEGPLDVLFEDDQIAILNKPAGMVVHPGAGRGRGTLAHRILHRYPETARVGGPGRPGIVHRLDRDTTGVLAVARTSEAYAELSRAFAERRVSKTYLAVVYGSLRPPAGTIDAAVGRHPRRRREMSVSARGRPAITHYRTRAESAGLSLLEIDLETGRTHQIRVHLKHRKHPLVGDPIYGEARWKGLPRSLHRALRGFARPALHAWRLSLPHPVSGSRVDCSAPPAGDLEELWIAVAGDGLESALGAEG